MTTEATDQQKNHPKAKRSNKFATRPIRMVTRKNVSQAYAPQSISNSPCKSRKKKKHLRKIFSMDSQIKSSAV